MLSEIDVLRLFVAELGHRDVEGDDSLLPLEKQPHLVAKVMRFLANPEDKSGESLLQECFEQQDVEKTYLPFTKAILEYRQKKGNSQGENYVENISK